MVTSVEVDGNNEICGVTTFFGITFPCKAAVLTTGTFMNGQVRAFAYAWRQGRRLAAHGGRAAGMPGCNGGG